MRFGWVARLLVVCGLAGSSRAALAQEREAAASAEIAMPELLRFVEAVYPEAARKQGLEADVLLALKIDADGRVTDAEVTEPRGHGFDEAAKAAALQFVFLPARRKERPVAARILYRYSFRLTPKAGDVAPRTASIEGRVLGAGDSALAGASVRVTKRARLVGESVSDASGRFVVEALEPGGYEIVVTASGFEAYSAVERVAEGEKLTITYRLEPSIAEGTAEIVVRGTRPAREVTRRTLSRRELARVPGTSGDALRALQSLPGVARTPALSGLLVVRGNADDTTPVLVDGMWIPNVYHFGGLSSVVPTEMLEEINFYPGNFSVRYGRALAGVVDAHLRESRNDGRYHGLLQLDLIDARVMLEGPLPLLSGWNVIAAVRRSHVDAWLAPLLEGEDTNIVAAPVYYDYQVLADTRPSSSSYLRLGLIGSDDRFRVISESSAAAGAIESADSSWGVGAIYENHLSETSDLDLTLTMARMRQRFVAGNILVDLVAYGTIARGELEHRPYGDLTLRAGFDVLFAPYRVKGQLPENPGTDAPEAGPAVTAQTRAFDTTDMFLQPALYAELEMKPNRRTQIVTGIRADYSQEIGRLDVSPRITFRHELGSAPRTTLKGGSGLFVQAPGLAEVMLSDDETELRSRRNFQNSLGVEQEITGQVELSAEGFFNLLDDLVGRSVEDGVLRYNNFGRGRVFGAELMLRYAEDARFFGWLSYTLSRSERSFVPGEPARLFYLDQTHILTALASYELGRGWEIGGRFRYVTGNLYTPCRGGTWSAIATAYLCKAGPLFSERLPPFHQLDVRVEKRWEFEAFTVAAYLDLINAYNRENPDFISYNYDFTESRPQTGSLPIVPSLGLRGEF